MTSERLLTPAKPGEPVLAYCRVSTETQGDDGYSLDDQARRLRDYARRSDLLLDSDDIFAETFSGARVDRPAMARLLLKAKRTPSRYRFILIAATDRAERFDSGQELERAYFRHMVRQAGLAFLDISRPFSPSSDARSIATRSLYDDIMTAFAGYEKQVILARTKMGREARAREDGLHWGGRRPFGYQFAPGIRRGKEIKNGRLVIDAKESPLVKLIYRQFLDGTPIVAISRLLNREYPHLYPTGSARRQAGRWSARAVRYVLSNPIYTGRLVLNRTYGEVPKLPNNPYRRVLKTNRKVRPQQEWIEVPGAVDVLIERPIWLQAQARLRETRRAKVRSLNPYVLRELLFHECGRAGTGHSRQAAPQNLEPPASIDGSQRKRTDTFPRGPRDVMPLLDSEERLRGLAVNTEEGERVPWGFYDPHRYYACQTCESLVNGFKVENAAWFWIASQLTDPVTLDALAAAAHERQAFDADAMPRLRRRLDTLIRDRAALREQQGAARDKIGQPGWSVDDADKVIGRLAGLIDEREREIESLRRDLNQLEEVGPLDLAGQERAELRAFVAGFQWGYYSPRLWHLMFSYFARKIEWGRTKGRRNRGWLRIHTTARLGDRIEKIELPMRVETLVRQVERSEGEFAPFRWIMPGGLSNDPTLEAQDAETMIRLFGPPSGYNPHLTLSTAPDGNDKFSLMWQDLNDVLASHEPLILSTDAGDKATPG